MNTRIIGIDLAVTAKHKAAVLDQASNEFVGPIRSFRATPAEMDQLLARARAGCQAPTEVVAVLEATGMAWYPVGVYLQRQGVRVYRVNGKKTRDLRQVFQRHVSSDRIDARVLAHLFQVAAARLPRWQPVSGEQLALQRACREYDRWRQQKTAIHNRLQAYDQWAWGGLDKVVPAEARAWVRGYWYDPWQVSAAGRQEMSQRWQRASPSQPANVDWVPGWLARAQQMTHLYGSPQMVGYAALQETVRRQLAQQQQCQEQLTQLRRTVIEPLYLRLEPERLLETIPGIALVSAATYIAFIEAIDRFASLKAFRQWTGMVPASHQSGQFEAKGLSLTKAGPNLVKATLYLNAQVARLNDVELAALYYRQMTIQGKHFHQAICACASHLASRIYAILKQQRPYQLRDLDGRPIDKEAARAICRSTWQVPDEVRQRNSRRHRQARREARLEQRFERRPLGA